MKAILAALLLSATAQAQTPVWDIPLLPLDSTHLCLTYMRGYRLH